MTAILPTFHYNQGVQTAARWMTNTNECYQAELYWHYCIFISIFLILAHENLATHEQQQYQSRRKTKCIGKINEIDLHLWFMLVPQHLNCKRNKEYLLN